LQSVKQELATSREVNHVGDNRDEVVKRMNQSVLELPTTTEDLLQMPIEDVFELNYLQFWAMLDRTLSDDPYLISDKGKKFKILLKRWTDHKVREYEKVECDIKIFKMKSRDGKDWRVAIDEEYFATVAIGSSGLIIGAK
jgi:hypothetical protein